VHYSRRLNKEKLNRYEIIFGKSNIYITENLLDTIVVGQ
jgi:hypothetical protein